MPEPRVLGPSRRRQAVRVGLGLWIGAFGVGGLVWGAWPLALVTLAIAGWLFALAALIAFRSRSYELHLDGDGFRVHDILGNVAHDIRWSEVVDLIPVNVNAFSFIVVGGCALPAVPSTAACAGVAARRTMTAACRTHTGCVRTG